MSFPVMIHLKSTLAVTALMLAGLVAASPFPYASDREPRKPRPAASVQLAPDAEAATTAASVTAWADPPAKSQAPVEKQVVMAAAEAPAPAAVETPAPAPVVAPAAVRQLSAQAKAEQARRRKLARAARDRQIGLKQAAPSATAETQVASRAAPTASQRIDPIGDILRGLGFGKEG